MQARDIRGVNLGGWLVLERWITPSLFSGVSGSDEYSFVDHYGDEEARKRLEMHRERFITKKDLKAIRDMGLNAVRLPVGYWMFEDQDGFLGGSYSYADKVFEWATEYDLKVIICLHGAPGSQNGHDHSGRTGWTDWFKNCNIRRTYKTIRMLCERYGKEVSLLGVELINEPHAAGWLRQRRLLRYYRRAGRIVKDVCKSNTMIVMSDGFQPEVLIPKIIKLSSSSGVIDMHMYQLFTSEDRALDFAGHIKKAAGWEQVVRGVSDAAPVVIGEWSAAMDELYEPRLKKKARHYTEKQYADFAKKQIATFESAGAGWFYWTIKTEDTGVWSLVDHPEYIK